MKKMVVGMNEDIKKDDDEEEEASLCPLFMEGLPKDFAANPQLAAIASLLEVDDDVEEEEQVPKSRPIGKKHDEEKPSAKVTTAAGGGKAKRLKQQQRQLRNSTTPYPSQAIRGKKKASLGEAQLFLNMWKI